MKEGILLKISTIFLKIQNSIFPSLFASLDGQLDKLLTDNPAISVEEIFQRNLKRNRKKSSS